MQRTVVSLLIIYSGLLQCVYGQNDNEIYKWGNWQDWGDLGKNKKMIDHKSINNNNGTS